VNNGNLRLILHSFRDIADYCPIFAVDRGVGEFLNLDWQNLASRN